MGRAYWIHLTFTIINQKLKNSSETSVHTEVFLCGNFYVKGDGNEPNDSKSTPK